MTKNTIAKLESKRLALQNKLDGQLDPSARNRMGQFATPSVLAVDILRYAKICLENDEKVRFLDPALGTGSFFSALLDVFPKSRIDHAVGYEIDPHYGDPAMKLWGNTGLDVRLGDFTRATTPESDEKFNLLICNPPYVRHHFITYDEKQRLKIRTQNECGVSLNGLAGLYCYFLCLSQAWVSHNGLAGWLIPSEFMDVNYGVAVKRYLLDRVTLLHIHRFDPNDVQFGDALVSSAIVWFRNKPSPLRGNVRFTFGGTLEQPKLERLVSVETLRGAPKWTHYPVKETLTTKKGPVLSDFFKIKRGVATGNNRYFILSKCEIESRGLPIKAFRPILPSPRYIPDDEIQCDRNGDPILEQRLFLLDPPWKEKEIRERYPKLWTYLEKGKAEGVADRYICRHRAIWYSQEHRPPAPFVCTYLGRSNNKKGRPFRFILNNSRATAANVYLMLYPREILTQALLNCPELKRQIWKHLNQICPRTMLDEGRVYGGGLHKLEPRELGNVPAEAMIKLFE